MRNHPTKKIKYRGYTIEEDWLGFYSVGTYITSELDHAEAFIDKKIKENPDSEESSEE
jgi:hypothetical protein